MIFLLCLLIAIACFLVVWKHPRHYAESGPVFSAFICFWISAMIGSIALIALLWYSTIGGYQIEVEQDRLVRNYNTASHIYREAVAINGSSSGIPIDKNSIVTEALANVYDSCLSVNNFASKVERAEKAYLDRPEPFGFGFTSGDFSEDLNLIRQTCLKPNALD